MKKTLIILLSFVAMFSCKTWEFGDTYMQHIAAGEHFATPIELHFTKMWGGLCVLEYDPEQMIDTVENFSYWNKLGGLMPDITGNTGFHQSARCAWRVDPEDTDFFYLGYIIYNGDVERGYLLDDQGEKMRIQVGHEFDARVKNFGYCWGVSAKYNGQYAYKRYDVDLKKNLNDVVMDLYYGGDVPAPTDIWLTVEVVDTNWNW